MQIKSENGVYKCRLGGELQFKVDKEKYIVDRVAELSHSRGLSDLLEHLIRLVLDDPSLLRQEENMKELLDFMNKTNLTPNAAKFYAQASKEINEMRAKIDDIHTMCKETYTLALFGKTLGLEEKTHNLLSAEFLLQKQLREIEDRLGIVAQSAYLSSKLKDSKKDAEDALAYIIEHYDGIVSEIKNRQANLVVMQPQTVSEGIPESLKVSKDDIDTGEAIDYGEESPKKIEEVKDEEEDGKDLDFALEMMGLLGE